MFLKCFPSKDSQGTGKPTDPCSICQLHPYKKIKINVWIERNETPVTIKEF